MKLRELFSSKKKWCKGQYARDKRGGAVGAYSEDAVRWCLFGGLQKCYPNTKVRNLILDEICILSSIENIVNYNDDDKRTFSDIKKLVEELDI